MNEENLCFTFMTKMEYMLSKYSQTLGHCVYETDIRRLTSGESSPAKLDGT